MSMPGGRALWCPACEAPTAVPTSLGFIAPDGALGKIAVSYLAWRFKGDETAGKMFKGPNCGLCTMPGWHVNKSKID